MDEITQKEWKSKQIEGKGALCRRKQERLLAGVIRVMKLKTVHACAFSPSVER